MIVGAQADLNASALGFLPHVRRWQFDCTLQNVRINREQESRRQEKREQIERHFDHRSTTSTYKYMRRIETYVRIGRWCIFSGVLQASEQLTK